MNNNDIIRDQARGLASAYLQKDRSGKGYICPVCKSGSGTHGTGITAANDGVHFTCWRGCFTNADIIDIIGLAERGIPVDDNSRYAEKLEAAVNALGINTGVMDYDTVRPAKVQPKAAAPVQEAPAEDYSEFCKEAARHIEDTDYWQRRGLSLCTVQRYGVGYCKEWKHPKIPAAPRSPRLIFPTGRGSYVARDTRTNLTPEQDEYKKQKAGKSWFFNYDAFYNSDIVVIVEGEMDALSIAECGGEAVSLGSVNMIKALVAALREKPTTAAVIVSLDNDEAGLSKNEELLDKLREINIKAYAYNLNGEYKDANERLQHDPEGLAHDVEYICTDFLSDKAKETAAEYSAANSAAAYIGAFWDGVKQSVNTPATSTGFAKLDNVLDGGLYAGLYCIGAVSSLGKTTLVLQIADNIAAAGQDVLIFSLEMARTELMAKSISRLTLQEVLSTGGNVADAKTARGIMDGKRYGRYSETEKRLIETAITNYRSIAEHIYIIEGMGEVKAETIKAAVQKHKQGTGNTPIVIVDYLQIISPADVRASDKQNVDRSVLELKRISRDYNTPVIAISALNRDSYKDKINMAAFKESGAVEYGSDCLIGLQFQGAGDKNFDPETEARKDPREIELVILKQRNGRRGDIIRLEYSPLFNYFREA